MTHCLCLSSLRKVGPMSAREGPSAAAAAPAVLDGLLSRAPTLSY